MGERIQVVPELQITADPDWTADERAALARLLGWVLTHGGSVGIVKNSTDEWMVAAHVGVEEDGDSDLAAAAAYGLQPTRLAALEQAAREAGV